MFECREYRTLKRLVEANQSQVFPYLSSKEFSPSPPSSSSLINCWIPTEDVCKFINACLKRIIPRGLIGSKKNWRVFLRNVHQFLTSSYDGMPIDAFGYGIQLSAIPWLQIRHKATAKENQHNQHLFSSLLSFIVQWIIVWYSIIILSSYLSCQTTFILQILSLLMIHLCSTENLFITRL